MCLKFVFNGHHLVPDKSGRAIPPCEKGFSWLVSCLFIVIIAMGWSCSKDDKDDPPIVTILDSLNVSISEVNFTSSKDASLIVIKTNKTWTASESADWLSLSAATGDNNTAILIGATPNEGLTREATVLIIAGTKMAELKIKQAGAPKIPIVVNNVSFNMILVEGGQFTMGNSDNSSSFGYSHLVQLNDYYISETEVTNELWKAIKGNLPYSNQNEIDKPTLPVSETTWNGITTDFIPTINTLTGLTFRLPTEAEWEYAALGGRISNDYKYAGSNSLEDIAWYYQNAAATKHNVKEKLPNELGLYDMSGNLNEWCADWYDAYYGWPVINQVLVIPDLQINPTGAATGTKKVVRGGTFESDEFWGFSFCNVKYRSGINPSGYETSEGDSNVNFMSKNTGFRLVISK
jgi:formylglycine-generating enzyme required for sulfatase activity